MPRIALSISILLLLFAGTFATMFTSHDLVSPIPRRIAQAGLAGDDRLGIDCGLGTTQAVVNGTGFPVAPSENDPTSAAVKTSCTWMGDAGQTLTGTNDGTTEPLVTDQDEALSQSSTDTGGGFTANVEFIQNSTTSPLNGFDLQVQWNPTILHAVGFDLGGLPWINPALNPLQVANSIDNLNGIARLAIVVTSPLPGNQTLFRIRFDIVGVGMTNIHITPGSGTGIANPGSVVYQTTDGALDSETLYDPAHTINWSASFTNSTPILPSMLTSFQATVSGGSTPYTYSWQFDSCNQTQGTACVFKSEATGNPVTIRMPETAPGFRIDLEINDSQSHSIHLVRSIPFATGSLRDITTLVNTFAVNTVQTFGAVWLGGVPPYTENARFCPGTGTTSNIICTLPNPTIIDSAPTQTMRENVTYKLSGVYTDTLGITDSRTAPAGGANTGTLPLTVNVTGAPPAYIAQVSETPPSPVAGSQVSITTKIVYATGYPANFESSAFSYTISFGDGSTMPSTSGTATFTTTHSYSGLGNYTIRVVARETSSRAVSHIQETGYASVLVEPSTGFNYILNLNPSQAIIGSGESTAALVNVTLLSGPPELVRLNAINSIPGASVTFSSSSCTPLCSTNMIIASQTSTPQGSYSITVIGNSTSGVVRQATFMLQVGPQTSGGPVMGVFSAQYGRANFTDTSLVAGSKFYVQVNVTNAPTLGWNGYEFALYYDQRYINVTSYDLVTNTVFPNPILGGGNYNSPGALRLSVVNNGAVTAKLGMLVNITFTVVRSGGVSPLILAPGTAQPGPSAGAPPGICLRCPTQAPNWSRLLAGSNIVDVATTNGYFNNAGGNPGPVASFTYSPANPLQGQTITFNATSSYDPDNSGALNRGIVEYMWDFGTTTPLGNETTFSPIITHLFSSNGQSIGAVSGNYTVRLTVIDSDSGFEGMSVVRVLISGAVHDIAVTSLYASPVVLLPGGTLTINALVMNLGNFAETFNLTIVYGPLNGPISRTIDTITGRTILQKQTILYVFDLNTTGLSPGVYIVMATASIPVDNYPLNNSAQTQFQITVPDEPPVSSFTFSPSAPTAGQTAFFNGNSSIDPDGVITSWFWNFGDGYINYGEFVSHTYSTPGNYTVSLQVTDSSGLSATTTRIIQILQRPAHDVAIIYAFPVDQLVVSGQTVDFQVALRNTGSNSSTVSITIYYNSSIAVSQSGINVPAPSFLGEEYYFDLLWNTQGVPAGFYTISATVFLPGDPTPSDNSVTGGPLMIFPAPAITASPNSGPVGTKVTVKVTGFVNPYNSGPYSVQVDVTFDNQFLGFVLIQSAAFNFTFNVPVSQTGIHQIHAVEREQFPLDIQTTFTVTPSNPAGALTVNVTTGTIYFPGDTATIFVQTSLNGSPITVTSLQAILVRPDNTNTTLKLTLLAIGVYKTTYAVPSTGPILGTYAIIVRARQTGASDAQSLTTFEVKLSWLSSQGKNITAGIAITGLVGIAAVAWRKGHFRRKDSEEETQEGSISDAFASPYQNSPRISPDLETPKPFP